MLPCSDQREWGLHRSLLLTLKEAPARSVDIADAVGSTLRSLLNSQVVLANLDLGCMNGSGPTVFLMSCLHNMHVLASTTTAQRVQQSRAIKWRPQVQAQQCFT